MAESRSPRKWVYQVVALRELFLKKEELEEYLRSHNYMNEDEQVVFALGDLHGLSVIITKKEKKGGD